MEFEGLVFKRMLDEVNKSRNATETLFDVMSAYNFDDGVKLNNLKTIMYELCNHVNNEVFKGAFKNPYNVSLYIISLLLNNYEKINEELNDEDYYIRDSIKPLLRLFEDKPFGPKTDIGKKYYAEEGKDIDEISKTIEVLLSLEDEEDILYLLYNIIETTRRYLADKYAEKIVTAIKEIDKIAKEFIEDGLSHEEILLSSLLVFTIVETHMDDLISGLTETEKSYTNYGEEYVNEDNPLLTKANCNVALGWLESLENDEEYYNYDNGIGYCRNLLENILFDMNYGSEVINDDDYDKDNYDKMDKFQMYKDAIIESVEEYAGFLCELTSGGYDSFSTSLSIYVDIFRNIY